MDVDPARLAVVWPGGAASLQPRAMQVLTALAKAGGAVVSLSDLIAECWGGRAVSHDAVHRIIHLLRKLSAESGGCGFSIHNVARVGYRLSAPGLTLPGRHDRAAAPLLAVLAFDDLTGEPDLGHFSDGVSEELLHTVSRTTDARVIGRSSSFALRGADKSGPRVAELLGATHLLDGSVRRGADAVRVNAQLVECATQTQVWSGRFDRPLADVLALQDDIAAAVARALDVAFSPSRSVGPIDPMAFDLYLRARDAAGLAPNIALLEQATARDPGFAAAWALLAYARSMVLRWAGGEDLARRRADVEAAARTALALDPNAGPAHLALSAILPICGALAEQRALVARALAATPNDVAVLSHAAGLDDIAGFQRRALEKIRRAYELDPRATGWYLVSLLEAVGRRDEAEAVLARDLARWPDFPILVATALRSACDAGDWDLYDQRLAAAPAGVLGNPVMGLVRALTERLRGFSPAVAAETIDALRAQATATGAVSLTWAGVLAERGYAEAAWEAIDAASFAALFTPDGRLPTGEFGLNVLFGPACAALRRDPRFPTLCARLGLARFWADADEWPDCAAHLAPLYDFQAECRRALE
ncbi:MAG TPA: winged helix-turn-helix domain-containing protein [Caulobacteraceae bacterium]